MTNLEFESASASASKTEHSQPEFQTLRYSSWLLVQIELELASLPGEVRATTLSEVEEHLRCSRMALEELGLPTSEAEREAVALFGSPKRFARQVLKSHEPKPSPQPLLCIVTAATFLYLAAFPALMYYNGVAFVDGLKVATLVLVLLSWRGRTFQWKALAKTGLAVGLFLTLFMGVSWVSLANVGGLGESPRWQLAALKATAEQQLTLIPAAMKRCDPIRDAFAQGRNVVENSPYSSGSNDKNPQASRYAYLGFQLTGESSSPFMPAFIVSWNGDYKEAAQSWQDYDLERQTWTGYLKDAQADIPACDLASRKIFDPVTASQGAMGTLLLTTLALLLNFFVFVLRSVWDLTTRKSRRTLA